MPSEPKHPISFPQELPISARVRDIALAMQAHQVVIVSGETGSGKTTQLPKLCLAMGRGLKAHIGCTQPRRIAATSVAARVAQELGVELGREIGYKIRFSDRTSRETYVKFVTDGILLAELQSDPELRRYDTLIVDEAHERNLNIDFLLGYLRLLLPRRPDLRVVISSATLETSRFSAFFNEAPVIEVSGRAHPVEVVYQPGDEASDLPDRIAEVVEEITAIEPRNDILVFLPGEREIQEAVDALTARALPHTTLLPLYGRLPQAEQMRVFQALPQRRIVLATNVAETSLTIPGIVFVVDSGLARVNRYQPRTGITQLLVEPISRASADQRKGRAGRVRSGVCYRLYSADDFAARPSHASPEIQRVGLAGVILQMKALGLGRVEKFPFLDPPSKRSIDEGYRVLEELGALDEKGEPNETGMQLSRLPLDPRLGRMVLAAEQQGCLREILVLAAALSVPDPRERPLSAQKRADECHRQFRDEASDFVGLLKLWDWYQDSRARLSRYALRKHCRDHFVSLNRMREWSDIHGQLVERCKEMGHRANDAPSKGEAIHKALLAGLIGRVGMWQAEKRSYAGTRQIRFVIHPSSGLSKKTPPWVFAAEIVETSQTFARLVAALDPAWIEEIAGTLCKRSYHDPHWQQRPAHVVAKEQVTLFGLPIAKDRSVHYGPIAPAIARQVFLLHALVRQELPSKGAFMAHNRRVADEAARLRDKARRTDMLYDEDALLPFFDARVPEGVFSGKTFEEWRKHAEFDNPEVLKLSLSDVLLGDVEGLTPALYPDSITVRGLTLNLSYRFEPGEDDDGITVIVPLAIVAQLDPEVMEWTIPGWHEEKIRLLLQSLPKGLRKEIVPVPEVAREIASARKPFEGPLLRALADDIYSRAGVRTPQDVWRLEELPDHLRFHYRVQDTEGRVLGKGRDLRALQRRLATVAAELWSRAPKVPWEREAMTTWTFEQLPEPYRMQVAGSWALSYPALVDEGDSVALRAMSSKPAADEASLKGVRRLILLHLGETPDKLERLVPSSLALTALARHVAGNASQLRAQLVAHAIDQAFALGDATTIPRTRRDFLERADRGRVELRPLLASVSQLTNDIGTCLSRIEAMLHGLAGKPGAARASLDDVRSQVSGLMTRGLFASTPWQAISHYPRYLRGIQVRLERLPYDPGRDADKAAQVVPLWRDYLARGPALAGSGIARERLDSFRWTLEELRVALFAPELKTAIPVSGQKAAAEWKEMTATRIDCPRAQSSERGKVRPAQ